MRPINKVIFCNSIPYHVILDESNRERDYSIDKLFLLKIKNITFDWIEGVIEWLGQSIKHIPCSRILREA